MRILWLVCCAGLAWGQGTHPKAKAGDYEVSGAAGPVEIGAEYMVHSLSYEGKTFFAPEHLVVEVALFPEKGREFGAHASDFTLRVDGKRATIAAASAAEVAASLERRAWSRQRGVSAAAGAGNSTVVLGEPQVPPYGQPPYGRTPPPPRAPAPDYRGNVPQAEEISATDAVAKAELPEGVFRGPVSGYLYFFYKGNAAKIRSVELIYGDAVLKLK